MSKLKKTLLLGGLVGAGVLWLTSTKKGKQVRDKLFDAAVDIYHDSVKKWGKLEDKYRNSKDAYTKVVEEVVTSYLAKHPTLSMMKGIIVKMVVAQWEHLKEEVAEKTSETKKAMNAAVKRKKVSKKKTA